MDGWKAFLPAKAEESHLRRTSSWHMYAALKYPLDLLFTPCGRHARDSLRPVAAVPVRTMG